MFSSEIVVVIITLGVLLGSKIVCKLILELILTVTVTKLFSQLKEIDPTKKKTKLATYLRILKIFLLHYNFKTNI